jgi:hypothetical protein
MLHAETEKLYWIVAIVFSLSPHYWKNRDFGSKIGFSYLILHALALKPLHTSETQPRLTAKKYSPPLINEFSIHITHPSRASHFGARGRSSVRYGTRLGDLKESWFFCFPIKHSTHTAKKYYASSY